MIRTTRIINECRCKNCKIIHLLGETFQGQRCCDNPLPVFVGTREVPHYEKTNEEEKAEVIEKMSDVKSEMNEMDWQ